MKSIALIGALCLLATSSTTLAQPPGAGDLRYFGHDSPSNRFSVQKGIRFERFRDRHGYQLRIHTRGIDPEALQVSVQGRSLVVENRESHQLERRSDRGSYQFAAASASMRRRLPLPPDADVGAMQRSVEKGVVAITLPYLQSPRY
ncbi:MAG: Hsp20/alpha crystallin family protein [Chromatiales bacterium]|jgi:HSP20 family molecular chaperone IbpA